jgi:NTE family protein
LNEFGYLPRLDRISSVSGDSIVAGWLGMRLKNLDFNPEGVACNFVEAVVNPLRSFAERKLDIRIVLLGLANPFRNVGDYLVQAHRTHLYGNSTLQNLPDRRRFVLNASNAQSGVLFRFSKPHLADYRVGMLKDPNIELAVAVGASSAFPPFCRR